MLSVDEFDELLAEELLSPRGERRADARHAINTWWIAAAMGGQKDAEYADYIPKWKTFDKPKPQTVEEAVQVAMRTTAMLGGTFHKAS